MFGLFTPTRTSANTEKYINTIEKSYSRLKHKISINTEEIIIYLWLVRFGRNNTNFNHLVRHIDNEKSLEMRSPYLTICRILVLLV